MGSLGLDQSTPVTPLVKGLPPKRGRLLRVTHIAARLSLKPRTVQYKISIREIPGFRLGPKLLVCYEADLDEYIKAQEERCD